MFKMKVYTKSVPPTLLGLRKECFLSIKRCAVFLCNYNGTSLKTRGGGGRVTYDIGTRERAYKGSNPDTNIWVHQNCIFEF